MQLNFYKNHHSRLFENQEISRAIGDSVELLRKANRLFFVGNGGSMAVCSHMMEDFGKICRKRTYSFSDPALITCYANDYGYENALKEWLKLYFEQGDLLIAISSSGNSMNIINAVDQAHTMGGEVIGLSGFRADNTLKSKCDISLYVDVENYGVVECLHHTLLHIILDEYAN